MAMVDGGEVETTNELPLDTLTLDPLISLLSYLTSAQVEAEERKAKGGHR